ncbi:hypothetical protein [Streptomyces sp. N50]|uniref:hypothetical protein n=1 Tax=Streptomyces sp. N50 TaxID=3081765 RepID=UPI0029624C89|nr:hypothetical protein [Streptomyces sp. N50]WOX11301.1 hypothetical protein R2B38_21830 [Streptomyces sp. N50]
MAMDVLGRGEARTALVLESVLSTAAVVWWSSLLWAHRDVRYADPAAVTLILVVTLSLLLTWTLWLRAERLRGVILTSVAVRGVVVLTLSLWFFQER